MPLGPVEEWGEPWTFRAKVVSEGCQHGDQTVASVCQRKKAEFVKGCFSVGGRGKWLARSDGKQPNKNASCREQPLQVVLIDALRKEGNDTEEVTSVRAELLKNGGG